jgi:pimeloyl-ACP methyl ester carboxylesterase
MYGVGGRRLHVDFHPGPAGAPTGAPTVVFEAALGASSLGWMFVERQVRAFAATVAYDRAGLGWSEPGPRTQDLPAAVAELEGVLQAAAPSGPLVLVGHSYGALIVRYYVALHPERVAGLVLVDPPGLEEWAHPDAAHVAKLETGIRLARRGGWAARCGAARFVAWLIGIGALELAARCAVVVSGGKLREPSDFNFTPAMLLPPDAKPIMRWFWTRPCFYDALVSQMEALPEAARLVAQAPPLAEMPLAVLSAADTPPVQAAEHERAARQSRRGQHLAARASGHWIPIEEPETVIAAVRSLVAQAVEMRYDGSKSAL